MDITYYFSKETKKQIDDKNLDKKQLIKNKELNNVKNQYINTLAKLISENKMDILDYTFLLNFHKEGGSIVNFKKFNDTLQKIDRSDKIDDETKANIHKTSTTLFKHLYDIINVNNTDADIINSINVEHIINEISKLNQEDISFTKDQVNAIGKICRFLYDGDTRVFGLYGLAGTGKTTLITKLIHYLMHNNFISSVAMSAPTNKAVNVIKSKFRNDLDSLVKSKLNHMEDLNSNNFNDTLDKLGKIGYKVDFLTIHKLLNYKNDFDVEGERVFIKGDKASIGDYNLVIIDECSMIPFQMMVHIFDELFRKDILNKKTLKVIFCGDEVQVPPVNEAISVIFAKNKNDFNFNLYKTTCVSSDKSKFDNADFGNNVDSENNVDFKNNKMQIITKKFNEFQQNILNMEYTVLREVVRSNDVKVIGLCNEIRGWILNEIKLTSTSMTQYTGDKVHIYKHGFKDIKTKSEWFTLCTKYFLQNNENYVSNIILTWTNKQCDEYNDIMRKMINNKTQLNKYEIGDILILTDFYNISTNDDDKKDKMSNKKDNKRLYTSEQIKVIEIEHSIKCVSEFTENVSNKIKKIKVHADIVSKYINTVKTINKNTVRKYNVWKLHVYKLSENMVNTKPEIQQILVVKDESNDALAKDRLFAANKIRELRLYYSSVYKEYIHIIDDDIIKPLWREINNKLIDPFAKVNYGFSQTVYKAQGSGYHNVFVDTDDILHSNKQEAKRYLYTALSRTSNELHLLVLGPK